MNRVRPPAAPAPTASAELVRLLRDALTSWPITLRLLVLAGALLPLVALAALTVLEAVLAIEMPRR